MNEKPEALLRRQHADNISVVHMKIRIERLEAENERLNAVSEQAQNAAIELAYRYQRMREVLERIAYASMSMHQNAPRMVVSLQGIAQAALQEPPR